MSEVLVKVTSDPSRVIDYNKAKVSDTTMIVHNTLCCKSKFYRIARHLEIYRTSLSSGEIAALIMRDEI